MRLKPFDEPLTEDEKREQEERKETNSASVMDDPIKALLAQAGISKGTFSNTSLETLDDANERQRKVSKIFDEAGASLEQVAKTSAEVMRSGDTDGARLSAARLTASVHGILKDMEGSSAPVIRLNIINLQKTENNIMSLIVPRG